MADDSDADDDDSFTVTQIAVTGGSNSSVAEVSTYNSMEPQLQVLMVHLLLVLMEHTLTLQINAAR